MPLVPLHGAAALARPQGPRAFTLEGRGREGSESTLNQSTRRNRLGPLALAAGLLLTLAVPGIASANYEYTQNGTTYTVNYDGSGKITVTGSNGSTWSGQGVQSGGHYVPPSGVGGMTSNGGTPYQSGSGVTTDWSTGTKPVANNGGCPAGETPVLPSGCVVTTGSAGVQQATVQTGSMVIISGSQLAQTQDSALVQGAQVVTIPSYLLPSSAAGGSFTGTQQQDIQAIDQYLQSQGVSPSALATVVGGTAALPPVVDQAVTDYTQAAAIEIGGANALDGAAAMTQLANLYASGGLQAVQSNLNLLAGIATSMQTSSGDNPWTGSGSGADTGGGSASRSSPTSPWTYTQNTGGVSLYQPPVTSYTGTAHTAGAGGSGGSTSCPAGDLGAPPNCYAPDLNQNPAPNPQPSSQWYAIAVPAWMNSWLNVGQQSLGNGDQGASAAKNGGQDVGNQNSANYVPTDPAGAKALSGGPAALLTDESAQVYGSYTVTTTETQTEYTTVTVPEQETRMVAETQTVPGYWHDVAVTQPGYYSTETVDHPGYYSTQTVDHPGYTTTEYHPGSCHSVYHPGHAGITYVNGRPHVVYYPGWTSTSCSPGYTTTVDHPGYTTTEQVWHPGYTTTEQVWNPPVTVMQAEWVPPTTETVEVPETYTAYVQEQQAYTVQVPVTETLTGWHTVTSQVAQPTVLTSGNSGGQKGTAADALYVAPVSAQSDPWLE